jgi:hypothetical protein
MNIRRAGLSLLLPFLLLPSISVMADSGTPAMGQLRLFGRWDLRQPGRALTVNTGSYILARFNGPAVNARFDLSLNKPDIPTVAWRIDNGDWQVAQINPLLKLADGLAAGPHTLWLMVRGIDEHENRWTDPLIGSVTFLGLDLPGGQLMAPLDEWDHPKLKIEFLGDSITEGVLVQPPRPGLDPWKTATDALDSHACQTAMSLGAMWRQVGFGATGLVHKGSGGAPGALTTLNFFHDGCPRDDWQPDLVVVNQGSNDRRMPPEQYHPLYVKYLQMIRAAYPQAKIAAVRPFNGAQQVAIKQSVDELQAAGDSKVFYIDTTGWYVGPLHPNAEASKGIAAKLSDALTNTGLDK